MPQYRVRAPARPAGGERTDTRTGLTSGRRCPRVTGATLVVAKLDRLSRNAAFLLTLRDSGVKFAAVDLPEANDLTVGIMALVAQRSARRSPGAPRRRWRWPGAAV